MKQHDKVRMWSMAAAVTLIALPANAQLTLTPGDVNGDGIVNGQDIAIIASHWGQSGYGPGDANGDQLVNGQDLSLVYSNWMHTGPTFQQVVDSLPPPPASAYSQGSMPQYTSQIGITQALAASANYGQGITIGIVDTGIDPTNPAFANRISPLSQCVHPDACTSGKGYYDDLFHGTYVASIAAGGGPDDSIVGIAPDAAILSEKVLNSSGGVPFISTQNPDGTVSFAVDSTIVSDGITAAAQGGAKAINVSISGYGPNYFPGINTAAGLGATVVFAAGNNGNTSFNGNQNTAGLTDAALSHLIIVGSVDSNNNISSFSQTPGTGMAIGQTKSVPYDSLFLMAPGGNANPLQYITGTVPGWLNFPNNLGNTYGTSAAAPVVTGSLALLDARWPTLIQNGTSAQVLFQSATPLGDPTIYGNGLLNLTAAFQPIGGTYALTSSGHSVAVGQASSSVAASGAVVPVSQTAGGIVSGGAVGSMPAVTAMLSNYTIFDKFQRNFTVNLSGLVTPKSTASSAVQAVTAVTPKVSSTKFADGSSLAFANQDAVNNGIDHPIDNAANANWFVSFSDASGSTMAAGYGFPASASFAGALWGSDSSASVQSGSLGIANSLSTLAEGGMFTAFGTNVSKDTRVALAWSQTQASDPITGASWTAPNANSFSTGITTHLTDGWQMGMTFGSLNEQNGLLGTTYDANGPLSLGSQNKSLSVGLSSAVKLADKTDLLMEASVAKSAGTTGSGLISSVSPLYARSMGASLVEHDTFDAGDRVEFTVKSPLQVFKGSASLASTSVDGNGNPITSTQSISLKPNGTELDLGMAYHAPVHDSFEWNASLTARHDADNIAGATDVIGLVGATYRF